MIKEFLKPTKFKFGFIIGIIVFILFEMYVSLDLNFVGIMIYPLIFILDFLPSYLVQIIIFPFLLLYVYFIACIFQKIYSDFLIKRFDKKKVNIFLLILIFLFLASFGVISYRDHLESNNIWYVFDMAINPEVCNNSHLDRINEIILENDIESIFFLEGECMHTFIFDSKERADRMKILFEEINDVYCGDVKNQTGKWYHQDCGDDICI